MNTVVAATERAGYEKPWPPNKVVSALFASVIDEFTHGCLAIRVARKLKAIDVIDVLSETSSSCAACRDRSPQSQRRCGMDDGRRACGIRCFPSWAPID